MNTTANLEAACRMMPDDPAIREALTVEYILKLKDTRPVAAARALKVCLEGRELLEQKVVGELMQLSSPLRLTFIEWINEAVGVPDAERGAYDILRGNHRPELYPRRPDHMPASAEVWVAVGAGWLLAELRARLTPRANGNDSRSCGS